MEHLYDVLTKKAREITEADIEDVARAHNGQVNAYTDSKTGRLSWKYDSSNLHNPSKLFMLLASKINYICRALPVISVLAVQSHVCFFYIDKKNIKDLGKLLMLKHSQK